MDAFDLYCKKCGAHVLKQHPNHLQIFLPVNGVGHAQLPGGVCPKCGQDYDISDPKSFSKKRKSRKSEEDAGEKEEAKPFPADLSKKKKVVYGPSSTENSI